MKNKSFFKIGDRVKYVHENIEVKGQIEKKLENAAMVRIDCCETYISYYNNYMGLTVINYKDLKIETS